ncbi:hypothetical protein O181_000815 [Austropuccinia psidii MF-1]|uniref:Endonuclease/exonuclease/phosphatase domain-containing protein n=1 Tax=Austropuccinia psidii MF-1 TaxID=1389203 RepID=A0A9Q3B9R7_9BASI|nr:hypothetical protein [Austropuccinia psidii MF-1]
MDTNLHHQLCNPKGYHHTHSQAKELISICGLSGFNLISSKHTHTYLGETVTATVIDLAWASLQESRLVEEFLISQENHSSDHQPIITKMKTNKKAVQTSETHISMRPPSLIIKDYLIDLEKKIEEILLVDDIQTRKEIDKEPEWLCDSLRNSYIKQGKIVKKKGNKEESLWDKKTLNPIIKDRKRTRIWFLLTRSEELKQCYQLWQRHFSDKVKILKQNHWRRILVDRAGNNAFDTFRFTETRMSGEVQEL